MENNIVTSVSDYIQTVLKLTKENYNSDKDPLKETEFLYRGQNKVYDLITTLGRKDKDKQNSYFIKEKELIEYVKMKYPLEFNIDNPLDLLAKIQHFGLPTRLLDVTSNPLVALYFACYDNGKTEKNDKSDVGEIFVFKAKYVHSPFDEIPIAIASTYKFFIGSHIKINEFYEKAKEYEFMKYTLRECFINNINNGFMFVNASETTLRQKMQQGKYILFTNKIYSKDNIQYFDGSINKIPSNSKCIVCKLSIPNEFKSKILYELKIIGVSRESMFVDSFDLAFSEIKRNMFENIK